MSIHVIHVAFRSDLQQWEDFVVYRLTRGKAEVDAVLQQDPQHLAASLMALVFDPADVTLDTTNGVRVEQVAGARTAAGYKKKFSKDPVKEKIPKQATCMLPLVSDPTQLEKHWLCKWPGDRPEHIEGVEEVWVDADESLRKVVLFIDAVSA